jgi:hypothetical protein
VVSKGRYPTIAIMADVRETYAQPVLLTEQPSPTDWMQAYGSVLGSVIAAVAAVASIVAVVYSRRLFMHEIAARRAERLDAEAAQARLVLSAVCFKGDGSNRMEVTVWNHSAAPILDLELDLLLRDTGTEISNYYDPLGRLIMPAEEFTDVIDGPGMQEIEVPPDRFPHEVISVRTRFVDAAGRRWQRTDRDEPVRHLAGNGELDAKPVG